MMFCNLLQILACVVFVALVSAQEGGRTTLFGALSVDLEISGVELTVRFSPEVDSTAAVAQRICVERASEIGVNNENLKVCVEKVGGYLQAAVDDWVSEKTFSTPLTINNNRINVQFVPEAESPATKANKLCAEHQKLFGFPDMNSCVKPVSEYLQRSVDDWYAEKTLNVPITVSGNEYELTFIPERESPSDMATKLCVQKAAELKVTQDSLPTCVSRVTEYLNTAVTQWVQSKTLDFSLSVNNKPYRFRFLPERESAVNVAARFCTTRAGEFQLTNENINAVCVEPLTSRIVEQVNLWVNSKVVSIPINVGDKQVSIQFIPEREATPRAARRFCLANATGLGLTQENFVSDCVEPVNRILVAGLQQNAAAKTA